jgi:predicted DNA-binding transcriptional regulator AlpA
MRYLNAAEAARTLGIGDKTIRRWLKDGRKFPSAIVKANGEWAIPEDEVEAMRQHRLKYASVHVTSQDQSTDMTAIVAKLAALEQEVATLKQGNLPIVEQAPVSPVSTPPIDAIPTIEVPQKRATIAKGSIEASQKRNYTTSEDIPADWVLCSDFFDTYRIAETTYRRWLNNGFEGETFEFKPVPRPGREQEYRYFTPDQKKKAREILKRHGKLEYILASKFAEFHDVGASEFEEHMTKGLGPGLIGTHTDTIPERDRVDYSELDKPGRKGKKERYLTSEQQTAALDFWRRHKVPFTMPDTEQQEAAADERPWYSPE